MYFAVRKTLRISGKMYIPCICYEVTRSLEATVAKLVESGNAFTSDKYMVFQSGKLVDKKAERKSTPAKNPAKGKKASEEPEEKNGITLEEDSGEDF